MAPDRLSSLVGLCAASLAIALSLPPTASADPPSWNGEYAITFIVGPKSGTSMAAGQPEVQYTDTYGFRSSCTSGKCTATIISGPPPRNPTVPEPVQFTWDGSSWTQVSDFQWDCMMPERACARPRSGMIAYAEEEPGSRYPGGTRPGGRFPLLMPRRWKIRTSGSIRDAEGLLRRAR